ncbi:hypothetical protein [Streptomyces noursei]|uniref:hypothetical protein n=1 Tax=Streptomyces noursei TaxID=1971 RepID=UPI00033FCDBB|nr:hypothetical protein [Streptomyces noursei]EOT04375.1 hypothetical protein K530_08969 [Streptomyces noursei CCRC 11814]EXU86592.1 hypothetical protein P354_41505 [Streptomyces noursei PD-1]UWS77535.1 hypothetical protein N1H47_40720 [Streptomyces noursei]
MAWWLLALVTYPVTVALLGGLAGVLPGLPPLLAVVLGATVVPALVVLGWVARLAFWLLPVVLIRTWFLDRVGKHAA